MTHGSCLCGAVHEFRAFYDLEVDTTRRGPHELARSILESVSAEPDPSGVAKLHSRLFPRTCS